MDWNDLKLFLAIAHGGSLAAAARELNHNHSTVFRRLNALEATLQTRLFERLPSGYQLTSAGQRMLELSQPLTEGFAAIHREIAGHDQSPSGKVRLTTAPNLARTLLPGAIKRLREQHPQIIVEVAVGDAEFDLNRREADLALRATAKPPAHLVGRRVRELGWHLYGPRRRRELASLNQLADQPLIGADASLMRLPVFQWLEAEYSPQIVARCSDLSTMAAIAGAGIGLAALPSDQQEPGLRRLLALPQFSGELWLLTHPDLRRVERIRAVWDALLAEAQAEEA